LKIKNLFDIAHADALTIIRIQEARDFLIAQREPGRCGYMGPGDKELTEKEERKKQRQSKDVGIKLKLAAHLPV